MFHNVIYYCQFSYSIINFIFLPEILFLLNLIFQIEGHLPSSVCFIFRASPKIKQLKKKKN